MEKFKLLIIQLLIYTGLFMPLRGVWIVLEDIFDGGIQESFSDSIMAMVFVFIVWWRIKDWIELKKSD